MSVSRRALLRAAFGATAALLLRRPSLSGLARSVPELRARPIPSSGELIPVVGLGSADTFNVGDSEEERAPLREVLRLFHELGGRVFDTAPTYGTSEAVAGALARELDIADDLFFATKLSTPIPFDSPVWTQWRIEEGRKQEEASLSAWDRQVIDLHQVHNLEGLGVHLPALREAREDGRVRYLGVTAATAGQYPDLERIMRAEELDFIQVNYSLGEREAAERILPLARDRGMAVIVNKPFNGGVLFGGVRGRDLPEWAADFDCASWGQFFLKYSLAHPAVTSIIPATSNPEHLVDNMGAGVGELSDETTRRRMERFFDSL